MLQRKMNDLGKISCLEAGLLELAKRYTKNEENMNDAIMVNLIPSEDKKG